MTDTLKAYLRLGVAFIALLNVLLTTFGWQPLPYSEEEVYQGLSIVFVIATTLWTWFKDSPITKYGKVKHEVGKSIVGDRKEFNEANELVDKLDALTDEIAKIKK